MSLLALVAGALSGASIAASSTSPVAGVGSGTVTTSSTTVTVTGGSGSYTYSTVYLSGDTMTVIGGTTAAPSFRRTGVVTLDFFTGEARTTVTDTVTSATATTDTTWSITGV